MSLRVRIDHGQHAGRTYRLGREGLYTLGRLPNASMQVLDMKVSKQHCTITVRAGNGGTLGVLEDLQSRHGTLVNGQPVNGKVGLRPGDEIRVGLSILRVLSDGPADVEAEPRGEVTTDQSTGRDTEGDLPVRTRKAFPPDVLVGKELGGYKVLEKIGQGGMGSVYVAEQLSLHREVALKVLSEKFTSDSNFVDQFVNEARSAAALNHPNVVQVYDVGREDGRYYFSMEYVPGGSLEERLAEKGPADWREALNWLIDASNALIFAQKRDILHRDVKPDNLMLAEDGSAKLCDLGLAKKAANADMLAAGIIGTPAFISPEAIRRRKDIDLRSDLYSLGCTFYRILTGENPYPGKTVKEILLGHLNKPVPRVSERRQDVPRGMDEIVCRLMQKAPENRFQEPQELFHALDRIRVEYGLEAHGIRPASKRVYVIAGIVLLLGLSAAAWAIFRPPTEVEKDTSEMERHLQEQQRAAAERAFGEFKNGAEARLKDLQLAEARGNLRQGDNWSDPSWSDTAKGFDDFAATLEKNEQYGTRPEVKEIAKNARTEAQDIRDYVELRKSLDKEMKGAQRTEVGGLDQDLQKRSSEIEQALHAEDFVKAYTLGSAESVQALVKPYREKTVVSILPATIPQATRNKFEGDLLLDYEKQIRPLLEKYFPGDPPGEQIRKRVLEVADGAYKRALSDIQKKAAGKTHEDHDAALAAAKALLEKLPENLPAPASALSDVVSKVRSRTQEIAEKVRKADHALLYEDVKHDRAAWISLLVRLRRPQGLLFTFHTDEALAAAKQAAQGMRYPGYQQLAQTMVGDVEALAHVMKRLGETSGTWTKDRAPWKDEKDREEMVKIQDVTASGVSLGGRTYTYAELGPDFVLHGLFYADQEPRFPLEGDDYRGLAVLAEIAIDYDLAKSLYGACLEKDTGLDETSQAALKARVEGLPRERRVAEAWKRACDLARVVQTFLDAHDPAKLPDPSDFWDNDALRQEMRDRAREMSTDLNSAWKATEVVTDPQYADTVWGTVLRKTPVETTRYAGEPAAETVPVKVHAPPGGNGSPNGSRPPPPDGAGNGHKDGNGGAPGDK